MPLVYFGNLDLDYLYPEFVIRLGNLLAEASLLGSPLYCHFGYRSVEKQRELHAADPKGAAPAGLSAHQYGLAVDCHLRKSDGTADWTTEKYKFLQNLCPKHQLRWGGDWNDSDHIQYPGYVNASQLLPLKAKWSTLTGTDLEKLHALWQTI